MKKEEKVQKVQKVKSAKEVIKRDLVYYAVGRRKVSSARVKLVVTAGDEVKVKDKMLKGGDIIINGRMIADYFPGQVNKKLYEKPFEVTGTLGRFAVSGVIVGGGPNGQRDAFTHGVSRALLKVDEEKFRPLLKKEGFLTRDSRAKQRRKAGYAQAARARKQSPKR